MANEIYNKTYWGDALKTAISVNDKPELFGSQFELKNRIETEAATLEAELCLSNKIHKIANL